MFSDHAMTVADSITMFAMSFMCLAMRYLLLHLPHALIVAVVASVCSAVFALATPSLLSRDALQNDMYSVNDAVSRRLREPFPVRSRRAFAC
mmetsp:Transcript_4975/g.13401  ORF Transcript_4975/g.13401 Transcript_4975/m.13401 type:complete len:92 (+) Transcript_4975:496-771(+)